MTKNKTFLVLLVATVMVTLGCSTSKSTLAGTIEDVRIVNQTKVNNASGSNKSVDAAVGAFIGGAITGGLGGAAIGAAIGADGSGKPQAITVTEPVACGFFVNIPGEVRLWFKAGVAGNWFPLDDCLLLKPGDKVEITKEVWRENASYWLERARGRVIK